MPEFIVSNTQMQQADSLAINEIGIAGKILMENAGRAIAISLRERSQSIVGKRIVIVAGKGNNGGDGLVIGRYLHNWGADVKIYSLGPPEQWRGDAAYHYRLLSNLAVPCAQLNAVKELPLHGVDIIIDALLGTGGAGPLHGLYLQTAEWMQASGGMVVAVDIPSGLNGDRREVPEGAVKADVTYAIQSRKPAHVFAPARDHCGMVYTVDIGIPPVAFPKNTARVLDHRRLRLKSLPSDSHKFSRGEVMLIGGSRDMAGALHLAARAAGQSGCGYLRLAVPADAGDVAKMLTPEAVSFTLPLTTDTQGSVDIVLQQSAKSNAILLGNGFGAAPHVGDFISALLPRFARETPIILDADALRFCSRLLPELRQHRLIFTPHEGELRALFPAAYKRDLAITERWEVLQSELAPGWILLQKGAPTSVLSSEQIVVNSLGGPELAIAGSGDILAGLVAGLCAHRPDNLFANCLLANYLHARAGEIAAQTYSQFAVTPLRLNDSLPLALKELLSS
jgi:hydroxyethylthiazole kinase-like uncharacterized protein yjeF